MRAARILHAKDNAHLRAAHAGYNKRAHGIAGQPKYDLQFGRGYYAPATLIGKMPELDGGRILDLGCGTGRVGIQLSESGVQPQYLDGIDASIEMLKLARTRGYQRLILADIRDLDKEWDDLRSYSAIIATGVFGHIIRSGKTRRAEDVLADYFRVLEPRACVGLTLGDSDESSHERAPQELVRGLEKVLGEQRFTDIECWSGSGHANPGCVAEPVTDYLYMVARRNA